MKRKKAAKVEKKKLQKTKERRQFMHCGSVVEKIKW